jgi:hypothetical protein
MTKRKQSSAPRCVFCGRSEGVQFAIFNPRFKPFGTACVECEATLPAGTQVPKPSPSQIIDDPHKTPPPPLGVKP